MVATTLLTVDAFLALPDDGQKRELVDGEPIVMPPPSFDHGVVVGRFVVEIARLGRGAVAAESGFRLTETQGEAAPSVMAPDVSFVHANGLPPRGERGLGVPFVPDLAVEVLSPSNGPSRYGPRTASPASARPTTSSTAGMSCPGSRFGSAPSSTD
jgi:Uma2 family endonuclease